MAVIPEKAKKLFMEAPGVVFLTASAEGQPNGNIIGIREIIDDETVYLSDQFFNKSLANLRENQRVAVVYWVGGEAYELRGTARYVDSGEEFAARKAVADARFAEMGVPIVAKGGCFVHVDAVFDQASGPNAGAQIA